jgi:hypothetical protein
MVLKTHFDLYGFKNTNDNEQKLYNDLVEECIGQYGFSAKYLPRTLQKEDTLFGEDVLSSFDSYWTVPVFLENVDNFEGEDDFLSNIGFQVSDEFTLIVSRQEWVRITSTPIPLEGDLIVFPFNNTIAEIKFCEDEQQFYPVGTLPQFKLKCQLFEFSQEEFNTGLTEIDAGMDQIDATDGGMDPFSDNTYIETEGDDVLDWSEESPFGKV